MLTKMNSRILQFLAAENISQSQFADTLGVARAGVSHIISGRNKPGFDFLEKIAHNYPDLSLEWLVTGKGRMYRHSERDETLPSLPPPPPRTIEKVLVFYSDGTFSELK